jgi:hypothetical protein
MSCYDDWSPPTCIIADGPYGLGKYPAEPVTPDRLAEFYAPHAAAWARLSLHANQKPLRLMERQIEACTDIGDAV